MALSLARLFSSKLAVSRAIWKPNVLSPCIVQVANKQTLTEELGLPPLPKRPISAYIRWVNQEKDDYRRRHPSLNFKEVIKNLGETWNGLSMLEKERWSRQYREEKEVYDKQYEDYMKKLTPQQISSLKALKKKRTQEKVKRHIRRERKKDNLELGKPKHPGNAFTLYMMSLDRRGFPVKEFLQEAAGRWRQLPEKELQIFREKAAKNRENYFKELQAWEMKMIREGRSDLVRQHQQLEDLKRTPKKTLRFPDE